MAGWPLTVTLAAFVNAAESVGDGRKDSTIGMPTPTVSPSPMVELTFTGLPVGAVVVGARDVGVAEVGWDVGVTVVTTVVVWFGVLLTQLLAIRTTATSASMNRVRPTGVRTPIP